MKGTLCIVSLLCKFNWSMPQMNALFGLFMGISSALWGVSPDAAVNAPASVFVAFSPTVIANAQTRIPYVPFYSQFHDIHDVAWQRFGCGIADVAMIIDFYKPGAVSVDELLHEGIDTGAYVDGAGWSHRGLALLAENYGLTGKSYDFSRMDADSAFAQFETFLKEGPVIASVYYRFDTNSTIPHLAVINGISGDTIYYNDPAGARGGETISVEDFIKAWKKRFIVVRPT